MNKLTPRTKGPFVIKRTMDRDGQPGVTYEITDQRSEQTWIVHHNRLKAYRRTLPTTPVHSQSPSSPAETGTIEASVPPLTALSGALPFHPPTPRYVPSKARKKLLSATNSTTAQRSSPPSPHSPSRPPLFPSPTDGRSMSPREPLSVTSHFGRMVRQPPKNRDFVT